MAANTPIYSFILPTVGGDGDVWGGFLNTNWTNLDNLLNEATNSVTRSESSGPITITTSDRNKLILVDATSGPIAVNFPASSTLGDGFKVSIKKIDTTTNAVTINPNGAETIDGDANYVLASEDAAVTVGTDASNLFIISTNAIVQPASETQAGIVELATAAETIAGVSTTLATHPAGVNAAINDVIDTRLIGPTVQVFTSGGTWNKPANVVKVKVTVVGAGGGAQQDGSGSPTNGGSSSFGAFASASGGNAGGAVGGGTGGTGSSGDLNINGGDGQEEYNQSGGSENMASLGGSTIMATPSKTTGHNYGGGGGCDGFVSTGTELFGGGGGGTSIRFVDVTSTSSETVTVGTGGNAGGVSANPGADGVVIVEEYYG